MEEQNEDKKIGVTLFVKASVLAKFDQHCENNGYNRSNRIEILMLKDTDTG
jgi:hypothetical protein